MCRQLLYCRIRCDDDHVHSVDTWFDTMEKSLPRSVVDGGLSRTHTQWGPLTTQLWWSAESDRRYHPSLSQMKKPLSPHAQNSQSFNLEKYCTMLWYPKRRDKIPEKFLMMVNRNRLTAYCKNLKTLTVYGKDLKICDVWRFVGQRCRIE